MTALDRLTARLLSLIGLDLDFAIDLRGASFSQITATLYVGRRPRPEDIPALKAMGITHVVSCLDASERSKLAHLRKDFLWLFVAMHDGMDQDIASAVRDARDFASDARGTHPAPKLLVHCEVGVSRSATLATALLMSNGRQTFFDAFCQLRDKRPGVLPNIGFASQLQRLEHDVRSDLRPDARPVGEVSSLARYLREVCNVPLKVELLQQMLEQHDYNAPRALRATFGNDIPRVVQGVRL